MRKIDSCRSQYHSRYQQEQGSDGQGYGRDENYQSKGRARHTDGKCQDRGNQTGLCRLARTHTRHVQATTL